MHVKPFAFNVLLAAILLPTAAQAAPSRFENSIKPFTPQMRILGTPNPSEIVEFQVALKMRDFEGLQQRIATGEVLSEKELTQKYYPLAADYQALVSWAQAQGLTVQKTFANHLTLNLSGSVAQLRTAMNVEFARIDYEGNAVLSAKTAPSLPGQFASFVLGVNGLQPLRMVPLFRSLRPVPDSPTTPFAIPYTPNDLKTAYKFNNFVYTGAGQKIAILGSLFARDSDLTSFWSATGTPQSSNNVEKVTVGTQPSVPRCNFLVSATCSYLAEADLDAEYASSIAPGAVIRQYAVGIPTNSNFVSLFDTGLQALLADLPTQPNLKVLTISYGICETSVSASQLQTTSQLFASLAAQGVTTFVSSGDSGSAQCGSGAPGVSYQASDPSVTAVGGTTLNLNSSGTITSETGWSGSGGGISATFARPSFQVGAGVPSGTTRVLPDVALVADPNTGAYTVVGGKTYQFGGTSLSSPAWAGFAALINQARASSSKPSLGLLGPRIYPLLGTTNFRDITSGSNGAYSAVANYDLVTGIGSPVGSNLLPTLVAQP